MRRMTTTDRMTRIVFDGLSKGGGSGCSEQRKRVHFQRHCGARSQRRRSHDQPQWVGVRIGDVRIARVELSVRAV